MAKIRVTVWNEFRHEPQGGMVSFIYPKGIHEAIAEHLRTQDDMEIKTATLDEPDHGLPDDVLNNTDVLIWWGHMAHGDVEDRIVDKIQSRITLFLGLIPIP